MISLMAKIGKLISIGPLILLKGLILIWILNKIIPHRVSDRHSQCGQSRSLKVFCGRADGIKQVVMFKFHAWVSAVSRTSAWPGAEGKVGLVGGWWWWGVSPFVRAPRVDTQPPLTWENNEQMLSELGKKYWVPPTRAPFGRGRPVATWRSWHRAWWWWAPLVSGFYWCSDI